MAFADYDGDGDLDLIVTAGTSAPTRLWRNDSVTGHHWLTLRLLGTFSNRSAIGDTLPTGARVLGQGSRPQAGSAPQHDGKVSP